jgi:zinc protease
MARSGFGNSRIASNFTAQASVKAMATDSSIVEFIKEIKQYADKGITEEELTFTKKSIGQSDALKYETQAQKASFLGLALEFEEMGDFAEKRKQLLATLSASEINVLAKKYLPYNNMIIVVVGDKKSLKPSLEKLGYPIVELDK